MLHIHTSNRMESLAQSLAQVIDSKPLPNPFEKEIIVVQSKGMERWLAMNLAKHLKVWANGDFPFPNKIVWTLFRIVFDSLPDTSKFHKESMTWSLMDILESGIRNRESGVGGQDSESEIPHPYRYLRNDFNGVKLYQLASRIADVFDQYMIFRHREIAEWEKGKQPDVWKDNEHAVWQAELWRALIEKQGNQHRAAIFDDFFQRFQQASDGFDVPSFSTKKLPTRLSIFGIPTLPPTYLNVFTALSTVIDIHVFLLNPCRLYWGQIVSEEEKAHRERYSSEEDSHLEIGNNLLASMGKVGRNFFDSIQEITNKIDHEEFQDIENNTLLSLIQSDILDLVDRSENAEKTAIDAQDHSVLIHACHSAMREVEVLHDQLLALFNEDSTLHPNDILVMTPDIEKYAPLISAVFSSIQDEKQRIPFSIADRNLRSQSELMDAFLAILELNKSRLSVNDVLTIIDMGVVSRRFKLLPQDLIQAKNWIEKVGIRWGVDGRSRQRLDLPEFEENTWRAGLNRLLLGTALTGQDTELFKNILPFDDIEGGDTLILGNVVRFVETLFEYMNALEKPRSVSQWADFLRKMLEDFLDITNNNEDQAQRVREIIDDLEKNSAQVHFEKFVSCDVIVSYLRQYLEKEPQATNFLTGKVTFCTLLPMRSIPFKIIYLLGMNDNDYPRRDKPVDFDLIEQYKRRGDRSSRYSDRYLFLESILSARNAFYISYIGLDIRNGTIIPPSVLVDELIDYCQRFFSYANQSIRQHLVIEHPLQAFSPRYFHKNKEDARLFSFSKDLCKVSIALTQKQKNPPIFVEKPLSEPSNEWKTVEIQRLVEFFRHPVKFFITERLGITLKKSEDILDEKEPFEINLLQAYQLNKALSERYLKQQDTANFQAVFKASGQLPHGEVGNFVYSELNAQVLNFVASVKKATQNPQLEPRVVNLMFDDMRLTGSVNRIRQDNLVHYRCAKAKAKDYIELWIYHLIINVLGIRNQESGVGNRESGVGNQESGIRSYESLPRSSVLIMQDFMYRYKPVDNAEEILKKLLQLYWQGLSNPLLFFPDSSMAYAEKIYEKKTEEDALNQALFKWRKNRERWSESQDDYYQLCFRQIDEEELFNQTFKKTAIDFFDPLFNYRTETEIVTV